MTTDDDEVTGLSDAEAAQLMKETDAQSARALMEIDTDTIRQAAALIRRDGNRDLASEVERWADQREGS